MARRATWHTMALNSNPSIHPSDCDSIIIIRCDSALHLHLHLHSTLEQPDRQPGSSAEFHRSKPAKLAWRTRERKRTQGRHPGQETNGDMGIPVNEPAEQLAKAACQKSIERPNDRQQRLLARDASLRRATMQPQCKRLTGGGTALSGTPDGAWRSGLACREKDSSRGHSSDACADSTRRVSRPLPSRRR